MFACSPATRQGVTIENYKIAIIRDLVYTLNEENENWILSVTVHLESGTENKLKTVEGYLSVNLVGVADKPVRSHVIETVKKNGEFSTTIQMKIKKVYISYYLLCK